VLSTPSTARQILNVISRLNSKLHRYWREGKRLTKVLGREPGSKRRCMIRCAPRLSRFEPPPPLAEKGVRHRSDGVAARGGGSHACLRRNRATAGSAPVARLLAAHRHAGGVVGMCASSGDGRRLEMLDTGS
jgi:hypothetical protein